MNQHNLSPAVGRSGFSPSAQGVLQRKCACGVHTAAGGECESCRKRRSDGKGGGAIDTPSALASVADGPGFDMSRVPVRSNGGGADDAGAETKQAAPADAGTTDASAPDAGIRSADAAVPAADKDTNAANPTNPSNPGPAQAAPAGLRWTQQMRHRSDALWYFGGEHPSGFSIDTHLLASGFSDPTQLHWRIVNGADKVAFHGAATGQDVILDSKEGSVRANDVEVEVTEGTGPTAATYSGRLTVRKPHHLVREGLVSHAACPPWGGCAAGCSAWWTEITYRVKDNVGGTIVGATVNENFPGAKTNDQANDWVNPAAFATVPFWANTNGTFVDNWFVSCGTPAPVAPGTATAGQSVDRLPHEFYVGSQTPARGVRVQRHVAHRYLGGADHENVVTPAP